MRFLLFIFMLLSLQTYCQVNTLLSPDSLLKVNHVKKLIMHSRAIRENGVGDNVYYYDKRGRLVKHEVPSSFGGGPIFITDYFFDSLGNRYASVMHGGENYSTYNSTSSGTSWRFSSSFKDSVIYYYEYNADKKYKRIYRTLPGGELIYESIFAYNPKIVTRKTYDLQKHLLIKTEDLYETENDLLKSVTQQYDTSGQMISTFTQNFKNTYNQQGQIIQTDYSNDSCSCISKYEYYSNGLLKSRSNVDCRWNKKFKYKYYKKPG